MNKEIKIENLWYLDYLIYPIRSKVQLSDPICMSIITLSSKLKFYNYNIYITQFVQLEFKWIYLMWNLFRPKLHLRFIYLFIYFSFFRITFPIIEKEILQNKIDFIWINLNNWWNPIDQLTQFFFTTDQLTHLSTHF